MPRAILLSGSLFFALTAAAAESHSPPVSSIGPVRSQIQESKLAKEYDNYLLAIVNRRESSSAEFHGRAADTGAIRRVAFARRRVAKGRRHTRSGCRRPWPHARAAQRPAGTGKLGEADALRGSAGRNW